jgi:hypothetical protein
LGQLCPCAIPEQRRRPQISLTWESFNNRVYAVETSADLNAWSVLASNLTSTGTNLTFATNAPLGPVYFRVSRSL